MSHTKDVGTELRARLDDYLSKAEKGSLAASRFLTPSEKKEVTRLLASKGASEQAFFWGGYPDAERQCLFVLPDYYFALPDWSPLQNGVPCEMLEEEVSESVTAVRMVGSGFRTLTHRDYLGSLLGLGLERDALGDVAVQNDCEAIVFCSSGIARFLTETLVKVASDTVKCRICKLDDGFTDGKKYKPISDTVASPRLDCVVAALTNLSRENAQSAIRSGLVEVDFEISERTDLPLTPPVTVSVRGYGRFVLRSFDGETRKGRLRMRADQLI